MRAEASRFKKKRRPTLRLSLALLPPPFFLFPSPSTPSLRVMRNKTNTKIEDVYKRRRQFFLPFILQGDEKTKNVKKNHFEELLPLSSIARASSVPTLSISKPSTSTQHRARLARGTITIPMAWSCF